jgi:hypothetical protein
LPLAVSDKAVAASGDIIDPAKDRELIRNGVTADFTLPHIKSLNPPDRFGIIHFAQIPLSC